MKENLQQAFDKAFEGKRLTKEKGLCLLKEGDLLLLGLAADSAMKRLHPERVATFVVDRNITYTNVCITRCRFCAFYKDENSPESYLMPKGEILKKIGELISLGGTQIMLQGGLDPKLDLDYYIDLIKSIKSRFEIHLHSFSPPEVAHIARVSSLTIKDVLIKLKDAGLDSLPGGGAEILVDRVRREVSPSKITSQEWLGIMRTAHQIGMKTTATMVYGSIETYDERIEHLIKIRELQDETDGFSAFIPWSFQPNNTNLRSVKPASGTEYLKMVAISRLMLDNVPNIQAGWVTEGQALAQLALSFGANDLGGILIEEVVVKSTGLVNTITKDEAIRLIRDSGKAPAQRNTRYQILKSFN